jgi:hypothetical protein
MTEGWLWTGQWPECKRIIDQGNHQSMELDEGTLDAFWSRDDNGNRQFFIINEAIISKLCVLGEEVEPCFEGASISQVQFSFEDDFKNTLFEMMKELKELLKGGNEMSATEENKIDEVVVDPVVVEDPAPSDPVIDEPVDANEPAAAEVEGENEGESVKEDQEETVETVEDTDPVVVDEFENKDEEDKDVCPECGKPEDECTCEEKDEDKKDYSLEEIPEYTELLAKYELLVAEHSSLETEVAGLREFKASIEKKEKEAMIASFYMLSEDDKKEVVENIDSYSLEDIEAKLSIICVRNRVSFSLEEEDNKEEVPAVYNVNNGELSDDDVPAWVKAVKSTAKAMQE